MRGTFRIRHIGVDSAFKVGAVLGGVLSALVMVPMGLFIALGVGNGGDSPISSVRSGSAPQTRLFCWPCSWCRSTSWPWYTTVVFSPFT